MPELPEVEVTRIGLADRLHGARVRAVHVGKPLRWPLGVAPRTLHDLAIGPLSRRGKYIWLPLARRQAQRRVAAAPGHVGIAGASRARRAAARRARPLRTGQHAPGILRLTDPRRFGAVLWSDALDAPPALRLLGSLGAEPFDAALHARRRCMPRCRSRRTVDQGGAAGRRHRRRRRQHLRLRGAVSGRHRPAHALRPAVAAALRAPVARVARRVVRAVELGGSTLRDFRDAHGMAGEFQTKRGSTAARASHACPAARAVRRVVQGAALDLLLPAAASGADRAGAPLPALWRAGHRWGAHYVAAPPQGLSADVSRCTLREGVCASIVRLAILSGLNDFHTRAPPGRAGRLAPRARPLGRAVLGIPGRPRTARCVGRGADRCAAPAPGQR